MTQQTGGFPPSSADSSNDPPTREVAREQTAHVGRTAAEAGQKVAGTAAEQASEVGREARRQARDLLGQARGQVTEQARNGQQQASEGLRSLAGELHEMADSGQQQGPASDLAKQAADKLGELAEWLSRREPGDLVQEVRALARRRPGAFLLGAAAAGILAGRLTRGAVDANRDTGGHAATDRDTPWNRADLSSAPPVVPPPAPPVGPAHTYPAGSLPAYPAGSAPAGYLDAPASLPPEPVYQPGYSTPPPAAAGYPAPGTEQVPTPPSGMRTVDEYADEWRDPAERRPEAGDAR
jgi:hypothetical protein